MLLNIQFLSIVVHCDQWDSASAGLLEAYSGNCNLSTLFLCSYNYLSYKGE